MRESNMEQALTANLAGLKYTWRSDICDHEALKQKFRPKFGALSQVALSDAEFSWLRDEILYALLITIAKLLRQGNTFVCEDCTPLQYTLANNKDCCKNDSRRSISCG